MHTKKSLVAEPGEGPRAIEIVPARCLRPVALVRSSEVAFDVEAAEAF